MEPDPKPSSYSPLFPSNLPQPFGPPFNPPYHLLHTMYSLSQSSLPNLLHKLTLNEPSTPSIPHPYTYTYSQPMSSSSLPFPFLPPSSSTSSSKFSFNSSNCGNTDENEGAYEDGGTEDTYEDEGTEDTHEDEGSYDTFYEGTREGTNEGAIYLFSF